MPEIRLPAIPSIDRSIPKEVQAVLGPMKQILDAAVKHSRESKFAGMFGKDLSKDDLGDIGFPDELLDVAVPPSPANVKATGGFAFVTIEWDAPGYRNHAYAEVWRSDTDNLTEAVLIGQAPGHLYSDQLGNTRKAYYWVRFISKAGVIGPYNAASGTLAQTALDPDYAIAVLSSANGNAPFFRLDSPATVDGVYLPAGIYMKSSYIGDGTIKRAKIGTAAIDSLRVADGAITTAKIDSLAVTEEKVGNASITNAKIANLAVTTGKIQDAAVGTLKIADQAVIVPVTASASSAVSGYANMYPSNILQATVYMPFGGYIYALATVRQGFVAWPGSPSLYTVGDSDWYCKITVDGLEVAICSGSMPGDSVSMSGSLYVSAGTHTVKVNWSGGPKVTAYDRSLVIFAAMR